MTPPPVQPHPAVWQSEELVEVMAAGLEEMARSQDLAGDLAGLDALPEVALHPLLARSLARTGVGVWPEQRYPGARQEKRRHRGRRCDLVLTPWGRPLQDEESPQSRQAPCSLEEAYWLEVKVAAQYGAGGGATDYAQRLLTDAVTDVAKLAAESGLRHAGALVIVFSADREIARHDLGILHGRCGARDLPLLSPATRSFAINDRRGNAAATLALFPVLPAAP